MSKILLPNYTYTINGVTVKEKIIPDETRWKDAKKASSNGFKVGNLYKEQKKINKGSGIPLYITIHNTDDLTLVDDDAEQYVRATYNENMRTSRVHFYIDDLGAWQSLKAGTGLSINDPVNSAEVGWHAGDNGSINGGNMTSIAIEAIMNDTLEHDKKTKDNCAKICAWLLNKYNLSVDALRTHTFWINKLHGNIYTDIDIQCTTPNNYKWCPSYILGSTKDALSNWKAFKSLVNQYSIQNSMAVESTNKSIEVGNLVKILPGSVYYSGKKIPDWVIKERWYVKSVKGDRVVIDENESLTNKICSPININYITVEK